VSASTRFTGAGLTSMIGRSSVGVTAVAGGLGGTGFGSGLRAAPPALGVAWATAPRAVVGVPLAIAAVLYAVRSPASVIGGSDNASRSRSGCDKPVGSEMPGP
jgi:hypothetical protein